MTDEIWIVERLRHEHEGTSTRVVSWHPSIDEAKAMVDRLNAEFAHASAESLPGWEDVEAIFEMMHEQDRARYSWIECDREECGHFDRQHTHLVDREPEEHEAAFIEQIKDWWHHASRAWQTFVEDEVMSKMADPPPYCRQLVRDEEVEYVCRVIGRDPRATATTASDRG